MAKLAFGKNPAICAPITGRVRDEIIQECIGIVAKQPDVIEWRADFFEGVRQPTQLVHVLTQLREVASDVPIIFTIRSIAEGGSLQQELSPAEESEIYTTVCASRAVQFLDYELAHSDEAIATLRSLTQQYGVQLILSCHNFHETPGESWIQEKFARALISGADIGKVAVMPNTLEDVLHFLKALLIIEQKIDLPLIAISMGPLGAISRLFGWLFGSQLTFAVGEQSSAPGQIPIEDVRKVIEIAQKAHGLPRE
jgi:3-dehydroquinate dehydratase-1